MSKEKLDKRSGSDGDNNKSENPFLSLRADLRENCRGNFLWQWFICIFAEQTILCQPIFMDSLSQPYLENIIISYIDNELS